MRGDKPDSFTVGPASVPVVNPWKAGTPALLIRHRRWHDLCHNALESGVLSFLRTSRIATASS